MRKNKAQEVSVGIIGLGRMGVSHANAVLQMGWKVTAVCDVALEKVDQFQKSFKLDSSQCFQDVDTFLKSNTFDLVTIATTADSHCELVCKSAATNTPYILCEKPMATSLAECDKMISACQKSGSLLAINHQMRFMPQYTYVKELLEQGRFGKLTSMNVVGGCFGLSMNGSHYIEAFSFLSASQPETITAWFSKETVANPRGKQFIDQAGQVRVLSSHGQRFTLEIGSDQGHGMIVTYGTEYGYVFVDELAGELSAVARKKEYLTLPKTRYGMPTDRWRKTFEPADNVSSTQAVLFSLVNQKNYPSGEVGKRVVNTLVAAYYSNNNGHCDTHLTNQQLPYTQTFPWA